MKKSDVRTAIQEARTFIDLAENALCHSEGGGGENGADEWIVRGKINATLRRKSMDLSQVLTNMRNPIK